MRRDAIRLRQTEVMLYDYLLAEDRPCTLQEILGEFERDAPYDVRVAIWSLVEHGNIEFTDDRKLRIRQVASEDIPPSVSIS